MKLDEARRLLDVLTTAVLVFDKDLKLSSINSAGENLLCTSLKKAKQQSIAELFRGFPIVEHAENATNNGQPLSERGIKLTLQNGHVITVDCTLTPLIDIGMEGLLLEMVDLNRHNRILHEEHLLTQYDASAATIRGLAHEIKNPLGGIRGAAQLLERELDAPVLREYTSVIIEEADRLRNLVERMGGPGQPTKPALINIHKIMEHVRSLAEAEVSPNVEIIRDYDPSLPELMADRDQLIQAMLNIVQNAIQAVGNTGRVMLRTRSERSLSIGPKLHRLVIRIDVIDNGPGVPPELRDVIFYPLISGRPDGTGLGLSIARSLVHRQGGLLEFRSRPGHTVFTTWLPAERDNSE